MLETTIAGSLPKPFARTPNMLSAPWHETGR